MASTISAVTSGGIPYRQTETSAKADASPPEQEVRAPQPSEASDFETEPGDASLQSIRTPGQPQATPLRSDVELFPHGQLGGPLIACPPAKFLGLPGKSDQK